jgi:hypothetical protein
MHQNRGYLLMEWTVQAQDLEWRNDFQRRVGVDVGVW